MNFIVYLLLLLAWAPSFGFAQSIDSPQGMINQGIGMVHKITEPVQKVGSSMYRNSGGRPGRKKREMCDDCIR